MQNKEEEEKQKKRSSILIEIGFNDIGLIEIG